MKKTWKALDTLKDVDTGVSGSDALNIIEQALTELEELKRDVKRYFELYEQAREKWGNGIDDKEAIEYTKLHLKLLKVGKENDFND